MAKIENPGTYEVSVQTAEIRENEKSGTKFIYLFFVCEEGDISGALYLSEKALPRTVETLRKVFGFDNNFETLGEQLRDKPCQITIELEEYEGKERPKVKWINAAGSSGGGWGKDVGGDTAFLKSLTAQAKRIPAGAAPAPKVGSTPKAAPPPRSTMPPRPAPKVADEDVPF